MARPEQEARREAWIKDFKQTRAIQLEGVLKRLDNLREIFDRPSSKDLVHIDFPVGSSSVEKI